MKLPFWINYNVKLKGMGGKVSTTSYSPRTILLGVFDGSFGRGVHKNWWNVNDNSNILFGNTANISSGFAIEASNDGKIVFGDNFFSNYNFLCTASKEIIFGSDVLIGWDVSILDGDGHRILNEQGDRLNNPKGISIGNKVWLCAGVSVLKGTSIADGCIIGLNSTVSHNIDEKNSLATGQPAKIVKHNINWSI